MLGADVGGGAARPVDISTAQEGPAPEFGFLDYLSRETETGRKDGIAFNLHDHVVDNLVDGLAVGNETPEDGRQ